MRIAYVIKGLGMVRTVARRIRQHFRLDFFLWLSEGHRNWVKVVTA